MTEDLSSVDDLLAADGQNEPEAQFLGTTARQAAERVVFLSRLLAGQYESEEIYLAMEQRFQGMTREQVDRLEARVYEMWADSDSRRYKHLKAAARRRIFQAVRDAKKDGNHAAVMAGEKLLSSIEGTAAPLEIHTRAEVSHTGAVVHLLGEMTQDEIMRLANAERARVEGDDLDDLIDVAEVMALPPPNDDDQT